MLAMLIALSTFLSCQKDQLETASGPVFSAKYTTLTLDGLSALPNPAASEQFALKLFDLKEDGDGLTEKELRSLGNPAQHEDLLYALLFVEKFNRNEILWSWDEPKDADPDDRSPEGKWKWTGGDPIASMHASGFKKWPAQKVKNRFQDPCGEVLTSGPVYQDCFKLCDGNLPSPCMTDEIKKEILEKIIADTPVDPYAIAKQLVQQANWPLQANVNLPTSPVTLMNYERQVISGNIVHYKFEVAVGSGQYDKIGIHRVVKEMAPHTPIVTNKNLFYQHGDVKDFVGMMLPGLYSDNTPDDFGLAYFLAENNIDVWGIDQAWCMADATTTDFSYMEGFGLEKAYTDLRSAMAVARIARYLTGNGLEKMMLAGYSSGCSTGFALVDYETELEGPVRHADAYIPIDVGIKSNDPNYHEAAAFQQSNYLGLLASGTHESFLPFKLAAQLSINDPDGASFIIPGFPNKQVPLLFGAGRAWGPNLTIHFLAGNFDNGLPASLKYVPYGRWLDFMNSAIEYQPCQFFVDNYAMLSDGLDTPFDDHFEDIRVPIYHLASIGGFAPFSMNAFNYLGSTDVTHHILALDTPDNILYDYGHIDLFLADNSKDLVWKPMLDWIKAH